jgi:SHO1 osmosensor
VWTIQYDANSYPNYSWLTIAFTFCLFSGMFATIAAATAQDYHVAIVGFLAAGLVLTSSSANDLLYSADILGKIAASGFILLSIVHV